jgi:hypothetical protein
MIAKVCLLIRLEPTGLQRSLLAEDVVMGEQEEAVRRDPEVQQAWKIAEVARARLLESVDVGDAEALAEAQRMLDALRKATDLAADAEDRARVHVGLLSQAEADRRATERHTPPDERPVRPGPKSRRSMGPGLTLVLEHPALAALLSLIVAAAAWLVARTLARYRKRSR